MKDPIFFLNDVLVKLRARQEAAIKKLPSFNEKV